MLTVQGVSKSFDGQPVLRDVSLSVAAGEIAVLLGPSGCGKTTLLRIIAGLEQADNGRLTIHDQDLAAIPVHERGFGFVFQEYALFPHKSVFENVAFGLRMQKAAKADMEARVAQVLGIVGLAGFAPRAVHELSGGEQQRVALARALAPAPRLLLLDEPLGALDRALRERLMLELRQILKQAGDALGQPAGMTAVYVTHDQAEAFAIADRVLVMDAGRILQADQPAALYRAPNSPTVARFLGMENIVTGEVITPQPPVVGTPLGLLRPASDLHLRAGSEVTLLIRPDACELLPAGEEADENGVWNGRLVDVSFRGRYQVATLEVETDTGRSVSLRFEFGTDRPLPQIGETVQFRLRSGSVVPLEGG